VIFEELYVWCGVSAGLVCGVSADIGGWICGVSAGFKGFKINGYVVFQRAVWAMCGVSAGIICNNPQACTQGAGI
jgi:hypothetical protein